MERSQILETIGLWPIPREGMAAKLPGSGLKLFGMRAALDEIIATAVKRQHEPQRVIGDLLTAEIAET